jgi:proline dehydrogenase
MALFAGLGRRAILSMAGNPSVARICRHYGHLLGARRFVAGESLPQALAAIRSLNAAGMLVSLDHLGEDTADEAAARGAAIAYAEVLDAVSAEGVRSNVSLKLTQLGLDLDQDLCLELLRGLLDRARALGNFVRLDMEDSHHVDRTLTVYRAMRRAGYDNVGVVIQAYLYRSPDDLAALDDLEPNVRLVKGAYNEPPEVAFPRKADTDAQLRALVVRQLSRGFYTAVATHDEAIIGFTLREVARTGISADRFEFQMLYGIRPARQRALAAEGHRMRVYVPFGSEWYPYLMRRLAERPANLWFVLRNALRS